MRHPRRLCVTDGCNNIAGTPWTPYWCKECDEKRRDRISSQLAAIADKMNDEIAKLKEGK